MSVTSGFFNSLNHDRRYNAQQMSSIFDGVINDGVFSNIGVAFKVTAAGGVAVNIGEGKAWLNSAWVYNDTLLPLTFEGSEVVLDRIDAIVVDVDHNESVRSGNIKIVKGTPSSSPKRPTMISDTKHKQIPLAYVTRKAGSTAITQADITNMVGTSECPYITGILQVQNIDNIVAQWNAQWNEWYADKIAETDTDAAELLSEMKSEFDIWFNDVQALLEDDVATALAAQVAELQGKFDDLAREGCVYDTIEDSDLDMILGSDGTPIQGKSMFSSDSNVTMPKPRDIGAVAVDGTTPMEGHLDMNIHRVLNVSEPEVDTDAANAGYVKKIASKTTTPRNLLDNGDFKIAQAGYMGLHGTKIYVADRWVSTGITSASMGSNGIVLSSNDPYDFCHQKLEGVAGKTVTFAVKAVSSGKFRIRIYDSSLSTSYASASIDSGIAICTCTIPTNMNIISLLIYPDNTNATGNATIEWAALYEGEYTLDTLPEYQPKGYGAELLECMRYFIPGDTKWNFAFAEARGTYLVFEVPCPCAMRVTPSMAGGEMQLYTPSGWVTVTVPHWNKYFHGGKYSCFVTNSNISGLDIVANTNYMMTGTPALCADLEG